MVVTVVSLVRLAIVLTFHNPRDHDILFMPYVPASPTGALFKCPNEDEYSASSGAINGWFQHSQETFDSLHPSFSGRQVMDDSDRNGKIEG